MTGMDLRQLEYFLAIVDHGGVNRAAAALRVAQPSLSQSLRRLEKDLGTPLFHRVGRGLVLAPAGEALIGPARTLMRDVAAARNAVRDVEDLKGGTIDIAALSDLSVDPLSLWVALFRATHPDVRFRIEERENASDVVALVRSGACELGITSMPLPNLDLVGEELVEQRFVLVCPPGSEDQWPDPVPIASLANVPFVMGEKGTAGRAAIESALRDGGVEPNVVVELRQRGALLPLVLAGGGVAILPLRIALEAAHRGVVIRLLDPPITRGLGVIHREDELTSAAAAFLKHSRDRLQEFVEAVDRLMSEGHSLVDAAAASAGVHDSPAPN